MLIGKLKSLSLYALVLALGLGCGYVAVNLKGWLKSPYTEGNYAAHFPDPSIQVVVYGTSTCKFCAMTRDYLKQEKIRFADFDVENDPKAREKFIALGSQTVPVILIGDRRISGFNKPVIEAALRKAGQGAGS